jgi:hypothetical protein
MTTPDIAGLCERLRLDISSRHHGGCANCDELVKDEAADTLERQAAEIERLRRLLNGRDDFIVAEGLWQKFCDAILAALGTKATDTGGEG